jgi:cytochrome c2
MKASALLVAGVFFGSCTHQDPEASRITGGDVERGRVAIRQYACPTCHVIPGITGANALVGPPLDGIASRSYLGGVLLNTPDRMIDWLQNPQQFAPLSAMPDLGVTERDARDIAAYLYTLR